MSLQTFDYHDTVITFNISLKKKKKGGLIKEITWCTISERARKEKLSGDFSFKRKEKREKEYFLPFKLIRAFPV